MNLAVEGWPRRHRISVDDYYRMADVGLLAPDARVELIDGEIIDMAPIGARHGGTVNRLNRLLTFAAGQLAVVQVQSAVRLDGMSEPQPDVAMLRPRDDFYTRQHALPTDVLLLVEVSDSTLRFDLDVKVPLYARHRIPEVWIFDLAHRELRTFRDPANGEYLTRQVVPAPGVIRLAAQPDIEVDLSRTLED